MGLRDMIINNTLPKGMGNNTRLSNGAVAGSPYRVNLWLAQVDGQVYLQSDGRVTGGGNQSVRVHLCGPNVVLHLLDSKLHSSFLPHWDGYEEREREEATINERIYDFYNSPEQVAKRQKEIDSLPPDASEADKQALLTKQAIQLVSLTNALVVCKPDNQVEELRSGTGTLLGWLRMTSQGHILPSGNTASTDMYQGDIALSKGLTLTGELMEKVTILYSDLTKAQPGKNQSALWFSVPVEIYNSLKAIQWPYGGGDTNYLSPKPLATTTTKPPVEEECPF